MGNLYIIPYIVILPILQKISAKIYMMSVTKHDQAKSVKWNSSYKEIIEGMEHWYY